MEFSKVSRRPSYLEKASKGGYFKKDSVEQPPIETSRLKLTRRTSSFLDNKTFRSLSKLTRRASFSSSCNNVTSWEYYDPSRAWSWKPNSTMSSLSASSTQIQNTSNKYLASSLKGEPVKSLEGDMDLKVILPDHTICHINVHKRTPMIDLLIQVANNANLNPSEYSLKVWSSKNNNNNNDFIYYKPSTYIGTLSTSQIQVVSKKDENELTLKKLYNYSLPSSIRVQVRLPRNQLSVLRVSPDTTLDEIYVSICKEKSLDPNKYEIQVPGHSYDSLICSSKIIESQITEFIITHKGHRSNRSVSTSDISRYSKLESNFYTKTNSIAGDSMESGSLGSRSISPDVMSNTCPFPPIRTRKKRAPKPPSVNETSLRLKMDQNSKVFTGSTTSLNSLKKRRAPSVPRKLPPNPSPSIPEELPNSKSSSIFNEEELKERQENSTLKDQEGSTLRNHEIMPLKNPEINALKNQEISTLKVQEKSSLKDHERRTLNNHETSTLKNQEIATLQNQERSTLNNQENSTFKDQERSTLKNQEITTFKDQEKSTLNNQEITTFKGQERSTLLNQEQSLLSQSNQKLYNLSESSSLVKENKKNTMEEKYEEEEESQMSPSRFIDEEFSKALRDYSDIDVALPLRNLSPDSALASSPSSVSKDPSSDLNAINKSIRLKEFEENVEKKIESFEIKTASPLRAFTFQRTKPRGIGERKFLSKVQLENFKVESEIDFFVTNQDTEIQERNINFSSEDEDEDENDENEMKNTHIIDSKKLFTFPESISNFSETLQKEDINDSGTELEEMIPEKQNTSDIKFSIDSYHSRSLKEESYGRKLSKTDFKFATLPSQIENGQTVDSLPALISLSEKPRMKNASTWTKNTNRIFSSKSNFLPISSPPSCEMNEKKLLSHDQLKKPVIHSKVIEEILATSSEEDILESKKKSFSQKSVDEDDSLSSLNSSSSESISRSEEQYFRGPPSINMCTWTERKVDLISDVKGSSGNKIGKKDLNKSKSNHHHHIHSVVEASRKPSGVLENETVTLKTLPTISTQSTDVHSTSNDSSSQTREKKQVKETEKSQNHIEIQFPSPLLKPKFYFGESVALPPKPSLPTKQTAIDKVKRNEILTHPRPSCKKTSVPPTEQIIKHIEKSVESSSKVTHFHSSGHNYNSSSSSSSKSNGRHILSPRDELLNAIKNQSGLRNLKKTHYSVTTYNL